MHNDIYHMKVQKQKQEMSQAVKSIANVLAPTSQARLSLPKLVEDKIDFTEQMYETQMDQEEQRPFLKSWVNKAPGRSSYRSPYSNKYYPPLEEESSHNLIMRSIQQKGNQLFEQYGRMYYGECISNFFVHQSEGKLNFAFLLKKDYNEDLFRGMWYSTHLVAINIAIDETVQYKLEACITYDMQLFNQNKEGFKLNGTMRKAKTTNERKSMKEVKNMEEFHLKEVGKMIEDTENTLRMQLENNLLLKTKDTISKIRVGQTIQAHEHQQTTMRQLFAERNANHYVVECKQISSKQSDKK